jgi:hypothetical protein
MHSPVAAYTVFYALFTASTVASAGSWWRVAAAPALAGGLLLVPIAPVATALHADVASWVRDAAAIASAAISVSTVRWIVARFAGATVPRTAPEATALASGSTWPVGRTS